MEMATREKTATLVHKRLCVVVVVVVVVVAAAVAVVSGHNLKPIWLRSVVVVVELLLNCY